MLLHASSPFAAPVSSRGGFLWVESGSLKGQRFLLPDPPTALLLGRDAHCNLRFDPELERLVGRTHARIEVRADGVYLIDLNSANGTFRNGAPILGAVRLVHGERFQLGGEGGPWLAVHLPEAVVPPLDAAAPVPRLPRAEPPFVPAALALPALAIPELAPPRRPTSFPSRADEAEKTPQRTIFLRQLAVIVALLVVACAAGVVLGLRSPVDDEIESADSP